MAKNTIRLSGRLPLLRSKKDALVQTIATTETKDDIKKIRLDTYVRTYLAEEIRIEAQLRNLDGFSRFLDVVAQLNAEPLNKAKIARYAKISPGSFAREGKG